MYVTNCGNVLKNNRFHRLKPKRSKGVFELKIRYDTNAYRTMYCSVTKDTVSVLHCFIKRSQRTSNTDISITTKRYQRVKEQNRNA